MESVKNCRKIEARLLSVIEAILPRPMVGEDRWFVEYQAVRGPYDPNGKFAVAFGFETQEAAVAGAEQNAEWSLKKFSSYLDAD
jgi:hypothetical protein